ncbi:MAG: cellulase family glycosylhydrolase, partial [Planctomycetes bacterium]|nr:cellulase family glycosylhydrolase [Planctomycetota bacterium]
MAAMLSVGYSLAQMEPIDAEYRNVCGMDFIPTYQDITTRLSLPSSPSFNDTASSAAAWAAYNLNGSSPERTGIENQLARIQDAGFNTVRVWLSFHYYSFHPIDMQNKLKDFLDLCYARDLHVIPVIWDADFFEPSSGSLEGGPNYENYNKWIRSPGNEVIIAQEGGLDPDMHGQFVLNMLSAATSGPIQHWLPPTNSNYPYRTLLLWDVMNEPIFDLENPHQYTWIVNTLNLIKQVNSDIGTAVTPKYWENAPLHYNLAANENLDVLAFNFYAYGIRDIEGKCDNALHMLLDQGLDPKPILVMEAGLLGAGQQYAEVVNLLTKVPATYTGSATGDGVGFCLFSANVGEQAWPA